MRRGLGQRASADFGPEWALCHAAAGRSRGVKVGQDYFISNQDELEERQHADLEPELDLLPSDGPREASASIEKLFWGPTSVKLDREGRLYVVDSCRHRIQIYQKSV
ncbi:hypothetical protein C2W62_49815 [Candidatus Entotheonella serta]|nr:hypothetical protein C2W62_49815 [Candidatus Entotheonella serta]